MDLLARSVNSQVLVKLKGDRELRGRLRGYDQHLNLILDDAEDLTDATPQELGTVILRGDNVIFLSPSKSSSKKTPRKKPAKTTKKKQGK
jgi:small nuclear ribonucleoprotein